MKPPPQKTPTLNPTNPSDASTTNAMPSKTHRKGKAVSGQWTAKKVRDYAEATLEQYGTVVDFGKLDELKPVGMLWRKKK